MQMGGEKSEPIAIVGSSCRLPGGVTSPSKLWELLENPRDVLRDVSAPTRFDTRSFYHENGDHHGTSNVVQAYLCDEDYQAFDHDFFNIHPREAETMDPQHRMLLEVVYEAVEAAGYSMQGLRGSQTSVFVGQMTDDYRDTLYRDIDNVPQYAATGISRAITANRVSYFFDWHGPSVNLDTACSSSLVALHQAVQALRSRESGMAVAAGVNLILGPEMFVLESKLHMLSPTGRCRMWDAGADGYARGEGLAVVVLKTLRQALADNDHIECVIRETGVNQDGRSSGLTVPSAVSQTALIRSTYARCGLDPTRPEDRCQYFEAHGTGTAAGDPREAEAIRNAFYSTRNDGDADEQGGRDVAARNTTADEDTMSMLYVGSVKTVVGHSEGAAGIVALLKASLAVQHGIIPPNMHFERLSPAVEPFYYPHLRVPTEARPWPAPAEGAPRRVSVNSFGFGGTNAHAIIESWDGVGSAAFSTCGAAICPSPLTSVPGACGPFTLSAYSHASLAQAAEALSQQLKQPTANRFVMGDLAWTLQSRRTAFPFRAAFSAATTQELADKLDMFASENLVESGDAPGSVARAVTVSSGFPLHILGVFTGQGAQWPGMGARLFEQSPIFKRSIQQLEESLAQLPDPPSWSLAEALVAASSEEAARVHEAEVAQPLTTALQIALVDLLRASGIVLSAVVGHSSGEIAAAYASGYLSARDAVRIAYYRGLHSFRARSPVNGQPGSMMAVGMALDEAQSFCQRSEFVGRITVAASNSPSSVTLSGDSDAIQEAKVMLDQRGTFARLLKVAKAYHSHHMQPCAEPYMESLGCCDVRPQRTSVDGDCTWYSSVYGADGRSIHDPEALRDRYWLCNMAKPVLFHEAIERAARDEDRCIDFVLEIGPHSALRGPATDTLRSVTGVDIPYVGLLSRGEDDRVAFSNAIGSIWTKFQSPPGATSLVNWNAFRDALYGRDGWQQPRLVKSLPTYRWDHAKSLLFESRKSRAWRTSNRPLHPLLGRANYHGGSNNRDAMVITWQNILKLSELEWLRGHQFQHQVIFPAAGYVSMATDAACALAEAVEPVSVDASASTHLVELTDLRFHRAIAFDNSSPTGVEVTWMVRLLRRDETRHMITAEYTCYSGDAVSPPDVTGRGDTGRTMLNFSGRASITTMRPSSHEDKPQPSPLPARVASKLPLGEVDTNRFYSWMSSIGLQYSGNFLVDSIQRRANLATVVVQQPHGGDHDRVRVHPATLDTAFQGIFAAYCFPGDGRMRAPHLPSSIDRIRIDAVAVGRRCPCQQHGQDGSETLLADCHVRETLTNGISGDVDLFCAACERPTIQVEGLAASRLSPPSDRDDRDLFARTVWARDLQSCGLEAPQEIPGYREDRAELNDACDRTAYFYLRELCGQISQDEIPSLQWHLQCLMDWAHHLISTVKAGRHSRVLADWAADTRGDIEAWRDRYGDRVEMQLIHAVGQRLPSLMRASPQASMLDTLTENNMLARLYHHGEGFRQANNLVGTAVGQLAHRFPSMRILEVGGGTGAATTAVLPHAGEYFSSYTFTDISAAFFHDAQAKFSGLPGAERMTYAVLDIEQDPKESGFEEHSFDLIIASNVLHATRSLARTVANCRRLLAPGGFLILDEVTSDTLYGPFIVSALPGWWLGRDSDGDGRMYGPVVSEDRWDCVLKENGFSGVDHAARDTRNASTYLFSVIISQATDDRVDFLRCPLRANPFASPNAAHASESLFNHQLGHLIIVGAQTGHIARTATRMGSLLKPIARSSIELSSWAPLEDEAAMHGGGGPELSNENSIVRPGSVVICLSGLQDEAGAGMSDLSPARLRALQSVFHHASHVLWVSRGGHGDDTRSNMMLGLGRTVMCESPHLRILFVHVDDASPGRCPDAETLAEMSLRMVFLDRPEYKDILWTNETELAVREGRVYIPRVKPDHLLNRRLASGTRVVEENVPLASITADFPVHVVAAQDGLMLQEGSPKVVEATTKQTLQRPTMPLASSCSSLFAFSARDGPSPQHIVLGSVAGSAGAQMVISLSDVNSSLLQLPQDRMVVPHIALGIQPADVLHHVIAILICESLLADISGTLWLHDAPDDMAAMARRMGESRGVSLFLSKSSTTPDVLSSENLQSPVTTLHPRSSSRQLEAAAPPNFQRLVFAGTMEDVDSRCLHDTLLDSGLLAAADIQYAHQDITKAKTVSLELSSSRMWEIIMRECTSPLFNPGAKESVTHSPSVTNLDRISSLSGYHDITSIVDWTRTTRYSETAPSRGSVPVRLQPLGSGDRRLFSPHKTYLLVGLAGEVGMSLIEWMAQVGARHFALVSRNPQIHPEVQRHLEKLGARVATWALDVADKQALGRAHAEMTARMPPIAGVANGAMVLRDRPFGRMTAEEFEAAMRPKALGTQNLDKLFHADRLDFFVLFASGTAVVGNAGQANYSAANMFMASLAEGRRRRGVAASVIYLGTLLGVGHVARALRAGTSATGNNTVESQLQRFSSLPLSEADLHTAFAEAVASGRPDSGMDPGLIVGLGDGRDAPWRSVPRFSSWLSHLSRRQATTGGPGDENGPGRSRAQNCGQQSLHDELAVTLDKSHAEGCRSLEDAFVAKLSVILQTPAAKIEKGMPLVGLGIDSLVAVEVRSWFLKELAVDVPILQLLGGRSLVDVCRDVVAKFAENRKRVAHSEPSLKPVGPEQDDDAADAQESLSLEGSVAGQIAWSTGDKDDSAMSWSLLASESDATSLSLSPPPPDDKPRFPTPSSKLPLPSPSPSSDTPSYVRIGDMSPAQARLYFLHQYLEDKSAYNVGYVGKYQGHLDADKMKRALWKVCTVHESLRSCYFYDGSSHRSVQAVLPSPLPAWEHRAVKDESEVWAEIEGQRRFLFDIEHGSVVRVTVLSLSPTLHHIIFLHHHIALDGIGWFLFFKDLDKAYSGREIVAPVKQSIDLSAEQQRDRRGTLVGTSQELAFWGEMYRDAHEPLPPFPFSKVKSRKVLNKYEVETLDTELDPNLAKRVTQAAAGLGVTTFHFYLSALAVFLKRCLGTDDFSIGIVDANRPGADDGSTMGYFLNMLPLRFRLSASQHGNGNQSFDNLARWCRDTIFNILSHARAPFDSILDHLQTSRSGTHHPLFQVALDYRQGYSAENHLCDGTIQWDNKRSITAQNPYDIFINVTQAAGGRTFIHWTTQKYMYGTSDSRLMMTWYTRIVDALASAPSTHIASCPIATEVDLRHAMELGTGMMPVGGLPDWGHGTLIHRVEAIARRNPNTEAIVDEHGARLTYTQVMLRTHQIARCLDQVLLDHSADLSERPMASSDVIGILIHPMSDYVCCLLAILRLGLTCAGLDLRNPEERLGVMLSDCKPRVLVCNDMTSDLAYRLAGPISAQVLNLDRIADTKSAKHGTSLAESESENRSSLDQRAVILYTSGSTGVPKGVLLSHRNLHSHVMTNTSLFGIRHDEVILQQTSPGFDFCLDQIFHALANGGKLVIVGKEGRGDPCHIARLMLDHGVTCTVGCPSEYLALLNYGFPTLRRCSRWRLAFSGGEKLTFQLRKGFQKLQLDELQFVNVYGPTEVTIACARGTAPYRTDSDLVAQSDYLYPMAGYSVMVVDDNLNPLPVGFPGELCIAGDGVALGYLNRAEETRRRFIDTASLSPLTNERLRAAVATQNPKAAMQTIKLYRSGDYSRLLEDGSIHLIGRVEGSSQVKIRGMRVELDEVSNVMIRESAGALTAAAVSYRSAPVDRLVAFVVFDAELAQEKEARGGLLRQLRTGLPLPSHMCPSLIVPIDKLPTNVNGKLDRAAVDRLPIPAEGNGNGDGSEGGKALTPAEQRMLHIWRDVLDSQPSHEEEDTSAIPMGAIDADSDFFQVGGSSMLAIKLRSVIRSAFGVVISLPDLFKLRTLARMAARVAPSLKGLESEEVANDAQLDKMDWAAEVAALFDDLSSSASIPGVTDAPPAARQDKSIPPASLSSSSSSSDPISVILTGATGFLGTHILRRLVADPRVIKVHCVARRPGRAITIVSDKIVEHAGDLADPLLGLSPAMFADLAQTVDLIIHNGAQVSFLQPYTALRAANAMSTRTLCAMALPRRVPIHFVSSAAVASVLRRAGPPDSDSAVGGHPVLGPVSAASCFPDQRRLDGYAISKWVSEALLEKASAELGLPTFVHRVANLVGEGAPVLDIMGAVIGFSREMGSVPALSSGSRRLAQDPETGRVRDEGRLRVLGAFDLIPVERVGKDLAHIALESVSSCASLCVSSSCSSPSILFSTAFFHHCSEEKVPASGLRAYMEKLDGRPLGEMAVGDWLDSARVRGLPPVLFQYLDQVTRDDCELSIPVISRQ